jgi:uncharacterized membrane protein YeaQ/YmgE (transglycosylase-associated protein family)
VNTSFSIGTSGIKPRNRIYHDAAISFFLALTILYLRKPYAFTNPRLCSEDGPVFFGQAITFGWQSIAIPYAGYYHTVPRLVAILFEIIVPPQNMGIAYNIAAGIIAATISVAISSSRFNFGVKWLFSIIPLLMPHGGEVFLILTNVQWIIAPYFMLLCIQDRDPKQEIRLIQPIIVFIIATTGPFSIFLLPFFLIRAIIYRDSKNEVILFAVVMVAVSLQIHSLLTHNFASVGKFVDWPLLPVWTFWGVIAPLFGYPTVPRIAVQILFFLLAFPLVICFVQLKAKWRIRLYAMALFSGCILFAGLMRVGGHQIQLVSPFLSGGERYFFIPYAMVGWALFILAAKASRYWRLAGALALPVIVAANSGRFTAQFLSDHECYNASIVSQLSTSPDQTAHSGGWITLADVHRSYETGRLSASAL